MLQTAAPEYLVQPKYTSPAKLAGKGGSAGGILIGRAITAQPDLFGAAIIQVGCLDVLRIETTPNGVPNIPEFGSVKTEIPQTPAIVGSWLKEAEQCWEQLDAKDVLFEEHRNAGRWIRPWRQTLRDFRQSGL